MRFQKGIQESLQQYPRRPTQSGTVPNFVEQLHNFWNSVPKIWNSSPKSGTGAECGSLFHNLWNSSTICGTAPPKSNMPFQDVEQCATFYCKSIRRGLNFQGTV